MAAHSVITQRYRAKDRPVHRTVVTLSKCVLIVMRPGDLLISGLLIKIKGTECRNYLVVRYDPMVDWMSSKGGASRPNPSMG